MLEYILGRTAGATTTSSRHARTAAAPAAASSGYVPSGTLLGAGD